MSRGIKLSAFVVFAILAIISVFVKQQNWKVDSEAPRAGTSAWQPYRQYSPEIEQALLVLARVDPGEVRFVRERGFPIVFSPVRAGRLADTTGQGVIEILPRFQAQPAQAAVLLAHEIFHEQRHDPFTRPAEYPLWRRVLWHSEEEAAHSKSISVAWKLRHQYPVVWDIFGWQWYLEGWLYLAVSLLCLLAILSYLLFVHDLRRTSRKPPAGPSLQQRTA